MIRWPVSGFVYFFLSPGAVFVAFALVFPLPPVKMAHMKPIPAPIQFLILDADPVRSRELVQAVGVLADHLLVAGTVSEAQATLAANPVSLLFVDAELRGADGLPVFQSLLEGVNPAITPILLLVRDPETQAEIDALHAGVTDVVRTPIHAEALRARVGSLLRLRQAHADHLAVQKDRQAAAADETVRIFARGVAHNFNNMLTAGMGFLSLAMDEVEDSDTLTALRNVELTHRRMAYLARQLLHFTGDEELNLRTTDVSHILRDVLRLFDAIALKSHVALMCDFAALRGAYVEVDEFQFAQALLQLLNNAREAMGNAAGRIYFSGKVSGDNVLITIEDSGPGMDRETLRSIRDPFYTTKQTVGVGLGLSSADTILRSFGARLEIDSTPGVGTTVHVILPLRRPEDVITEHQASDGRFIDGLNVLLAVDAQETRNAIQAILLAGSFLVDTAETEKELLTSLQARTQHYHLLVVDLLRSELVGEEMIAALRAITQLPIIFLYSTRNEAPSESESVAILRKPFDAEGLLDALRRFPSLLRPETDA